MSFNLATILRESARRTPDSTVLRFGSSSLSYAELDELSSRCARGLRAQGLAPGDAVAVQLPNFPEFLVSYFGILKAGLVMVPLNPLLRAPEVAYHLGDSAAKLVICFVGFLDETVKVIGDLPLFVVPMPGSEPPEGLAAFAALLAEPRDPANDIIPRHADDTAVIIYTSGTTGKPKGAELTHFQLYMGCTVGGELFEMRRDDRILAVLPFFHVFGLAAIINVAVRFGASMSALARFEPGPVVDTLERDRVTVVVGVPTMFQALMTQDVSGRDLGALRVGVSGGASLPGDVLRAFEEKFGFVILEGYGMSETGAICTFNKSAEARKVLSIGQPQWGVEVLVVDDDDQPVPAGRDHIGELLVRGHVVMKGYLGRPEDTAEALRNGWLHTGDLGYVDEDGYLFIVDRSKDLVIRGGYNVYPREVEEVLYGHPAVAEVAVIGTPDERLGEEVVAVLALQPGATVTPDELTAFCKERLAPYKYPREFRFVDVLPRGPSGKILKTELRQATAAPVAPG
jgi:long-chain acyl-CoA synthetase